MLALTQGKAWESGRGCKSGAVGLGWRGWRSGLCSVPHFLSGVEATSSLGRDLFISSSEEHGACLGLDPVGQARPRPVQSGGRRRGRARPRACRVRQWPQESPMPASLGFPGSGWGPEDHSLMTLGSGQPSQMVLDAFCLLSTPPLPLLPRQSACSREQTGDRRQDLLEDKEPFLWGGGPGGGGGPGSGGSRDESDPRQRGQRAVMGETPSVVGPGLLCGQGEVRTDPRDLCLAQRVFETAPEMLAQSEGSGREMGGKGEPGGARAGEQPPEGRPRPRRRC